MQWWHNAAFHLSPRYKGQMTPNTVAAFSAATSAMASDTSMDAPEAANQGGGRRSEETHARTRRKLRNMMDLVAVVMMMTALATSPFLARRPTCSTEWGY